MTIPQEVLDRWPNCSTPDCENKACLWLSTGKCFPCSTGVDRAAWDPQQSDERRDQLLRDAGTYEWVKMVYEATHPGVPW